jgi:hypothetical protein
MKMPMCPTEPLKTLNNFNTLDIFDLHEGETADLPTKARKIRVHTIYDDVCHCAAYVTVELGYSEETPNPNYEKQYTKYLKDMEKYNQQIIKYEQYKKDYDVNYSRIFDKWRVSGTARNSIRNRSRQARIPSSSNFKLSNDWVSKKPPHYK